jgi:hypothetical protein
MKPGALLLFLALCWAGGALVHHFTESQAAPGHAVRGARVTGGSSGVAAGRSSEEAFARHDTSGMATVLKAMINDRHEVNWVLLEERLSAMAPGDYLLVIRELDGRNELFLNHVNDAKKSLLQRAAAADARGLLALAEERAEDKEERLETVGRFCFPHAPAEVFAAILRMDGGHGIDSFSPGARLMRSVMEEANPAVALPAAEQAGMMDAYRDYFVGQMIRWADRDGPAAMAFALKYPSLLEAALVPWAGRDIDAALAWLRASPEREELVFGKPDASSVPPLDRLCQEYAKLHPHEAERFADQVKDPAFFRQSQAAGMAGEPAEKTAAWIRTLPVELQAGTCDALLMVLKDTDPEKAFALGREFPSSLVSPAGLRLLAVEARMRPAETAEFVQTAGVPDEVKDPFSEIVLGTWLMVDNPAAMRYLQSQPPGEQNGRLLLEGSQLLVYETREAAEAFAMALPDPSQRLGAFRRILELEFQNSTTAGPAQQWIESLPDPAVRAALQNPTTAAPGN